MAEERERRAREAFEVAEAERWARGEPAWGPAGEDVRLASMGAARSRAGDRDGRGPTGKAPHDPDRALFGGWRIEEMEEKAGDHEALIARRTVDSLLR